MPATLPTPRGGGANCEAVSLTERVCILEELLASDKLFVDYFNMFLQLPCFPDPIVYNRQTGGFEVQSSHIKSSLAADMRSAFRIGRADKSLYDVTKKHSFSPIPIIAIEKQPPEVKHVKTIFTVQTLDMEQGIEWIKTERLPAFLDSDCYLEYRLAKLLSQTECRPLPSELISVRLIIAQPMSADLDRDRPMTSSHWLQTKLLMSKLHISSGDTPTSQTDLYISQAKAHFNGTTTTSSSRATSHGSVTSPHHSLPDPVCVVDKRYIRPVSAVYVEQSKKRPASSNSSLSGTLPLHSNMDDVESSSTLDKVNESQNIDNKEENKENESTFNSDDDYETESDIAMFCQHRRPRSVRPGEVLSTLRGVQLLLKFLGGNAGEKYWNLWLDIERAKVAHNNDELQNHLMAMRERYCNSGSPLELPIESRRQLSLLQPSDWNMSRLNFVQAKLLEPLINYWVPRFLSEQQGKPQLEHHHAYQEQLKLKPRPMSCPDPRTALYQPHRPRTCIPRDRVRPTVINQQSSATLTSPHRRVYSASATRCSNRRQPMASKRQEERQEDDLQANRRPAWQPSSIECDEFNGSRQMEALLQALRYDNNAGKVLRKHVEKSGNSLWRNSLRFWQCCQEYHKLFYTETIDNFLIEKKAKFIYATFTLPSSPMNISCGADVTRVIGQKLVSATEELFDDAEEYVLSILYVAWCDAMRSDSSTYNKVDKLNVRRRLNASLNKSQPTCDSESQPEQTIVMEEDSTEINGASTERTLLNSQQSIEGAPQVPPKFRDFTLLKIVQNRFELEHFRRFLSENYASLDLVCWLDIEALRRIPTTQGELKTKKATAIRRKYFNINYFFGPNSPATKQEQDKMINALGGRTGLILDLPPPIESLYSAQSYIERRLDAKWLPLFLSSPQFAERQRLHIGLGHVVDDAILQRRRRALTIQKLLGNKWQVSQDKINQFRISLLNPLTSQLFRRYISVKGEFHVNNVLFWLEIEKFKELCQLNTDQQMMQQKANAIINCFVDSQIPPAIQVTVEPELVQIVLERRSDASENMFKEAQRRVFIELMPQWEEFCKYRQENQVSDDQLLTLLDERRRQSNRTVDGRKDTKRNEKQSKGTTQSASHRKSSGTISTEFDLFGSIENCSSTSSMTGADSTEPGSREQARSQVDWSSRAQRHRVVTWTYSRYIQALNKEQCLNHTAAIATSSLPVRPPVEAVLSHPIIDLDDSQLDSDSLNVIKNALNSMTSLATVEVASSVGSHSMAADLRSQSLSLPHQQSLDSTSPVPTKVKKSVRVLSPTPSNSRTTMNIG